jgi:hypothetical protein
MQIVAATATTAVVRKPNHCVNNSITIYKFTFWNTRRNKAKTTTYTLLEPEEQLVNFGQEAEVGKESVL